MTSCQAQACTQHLNSIQGSIYHKLWGGWRQIWGGDGADVEDDDDAVDVMEMLPLCQGGVDGVDGGDFPPAAVADQPLRRRKKGSASTAASKNYREIRVSLFWRYGVIHKKMEAMQPLRAKWAWVARPTRVAAPPGFIWASWPLSCATTSPGASRVKILML
jgi:hypothetical protein